MGAVLVMLALAGCSMVNVGCAGSRAYANVTVGTGSAAYDAVIVLQAQGSAWVR
ncbi:MAG TPA: hypothetical protein VEG62_01705 [Acidimicrobiales bacterium]|nr:hypothetical protein [Acidimicrobiales bacterium]HXZ61427.1 hypothetical protein [Acidimicrobiales bacterium]